jgi:hypothetical protein
VRLSPFVGTMDQRLLKVAKMYIYELLSAWGRMFPDKTFGDRVGFTGPPDEDGYIRFEAAEGEGFEGRLVDEHEIGGSMGLALDYFNELNRTEYGRGVLNEAYSRWRAQKENA